ncbi:hypothetical protein GUJ93_ZPchr0012g18857 [Zizania palustris]|uniref:Uncharacterized protein n=1 Tax=Zizania palustris TaxID=103762 RepID=A0A8J5WMV9_ZIZPA|nr:hypothetical protein GUJ93_ZPchr0012g18857 [Zizania palustris]
MEARAGAQNAVLTPSILCLPDCTHQNRVRLSISTAASPADGAVLGTPTVLIVERRRRLGRPSCDDAANVAESTVGPRGVASA